MLEKSWQEKHSSTDPTEKLNRGPLDFSPNHEKGRKNAPELRQRRVGTRKGREKCPGHERKGNCRSNSPLSAVIKEGHTKKKNKRTEIKARLRKKKKKEEAQSRRHMGRS